VAERVTTRVRRGSFMGVGGVSGITVELTGIPNGVGRFLTFHGAGRVAIRSLVQQCNAAASKSREGRFGGMALAVICSGSATCPVGNEGGWV